MFGRTLEHPLIYSHTQREQISFVTAPSTKLLGCSEAICSIACSLEPVYACLSGISLLQFLRNCFDCDLVSCNASPDVSYTVIIHYCILLGIFFTGYSRFWLPLSIGEVASDSYQLACVRLSDDDLGHYICPMSKHYNY